MFVEVGLYSVLVALAHSFCYGFGSASFHLFIFFSFLFFSFRSYRIKRSGYAWRNGD